MVAAALGLALAACGGGKAAAPIGNTGEGTGGEPLAVATPEAFRDNALWSCQISDYDPQPCKLRQVDGHWELRKLMGSQRFRGTLTPTADGLAFSGSFFCPWGACDASMDVQFAKEGDGYVGRFEDDDIHLRHDAALEAEYGAAGYGGLTGDEK